MIACSRDRGLIDLISPGLVSTRAADSLHYPLNALAADWTATSTFHNSPRTWLAAADMHAAKMIKVSAYRLTTTLLLAKLPICQIITALRS